MNDQIQVGLIFGGQSAEHAVSLESGKNVYEALDSKKYNVHLIGIDHGGVWRYVENADQLTKTQVAKPIDLTTAGPAVFLIPGKSGVEIMEIESKKVRGRVDCVFPILHGPYGEDGTMQGYLRLLGLPYVGSGVLGSAVGMDKEFSKRLLRDSGLPVGKFLSLHQSDQPDRHSVNEFAEIQKQLGLPFFLKPANMGSSVGVHKVHNAEEFQKAKMDAFKYDCKLMVEEFIEGREIECSVLGNHELKATRPGEVQPQHEFYSFAAKYLDENGALLQIPAKLSEAKMDEVKLLAKKTFQSLGCQGFARVDFFLKKDGTLLVNEINTIPGFTKISMYPKMWANEGLSYPALIDRLLELAFERLKEERNLSR